MNLAWHGHEFLANWSFDILGLGFGALAGTTWNDTRGLVGLGLDIIGRAPTVNVLVLLV